MYTISSSKRSQINYITVNHVLFTHRCLTRRRTLSPRSVPHWSLYHSAPPLSVCWWRQSMASFCRRLVAVFLSSAVFWLVRGSALAPGSVSCWRGSWLWWYSRPVIAWSGGYPDYCTHLLFSGNTNTGSNPAPNQIVLYENTQSQCQKHKVNIAISYESLATWFFYSQKISYLYLTDFIE